MCTLRLIKFTVLRVPGRATQVRACCTRSDQEVFNLEFDIQRKYFATFSDLLK